jgi:hypothetical protein
MNLLKNILGKKSKSNISNEEFWNWFLQNEKRFFASVKERTNVQKEFFAPLSPKLKELKDGYFFLTGMMDDHTVELIITADGSVKNFVFVEELIASAPKIDGWKFTALKPALDLENISIDLEGFHFSNENISFYANELNDMPDEIDISIVHNDLKDDNRPAITNGIFIFLDSYLGELQLATTVDNLQVVERKNAAKELAPISKLKDYLTWREKEFLEKYEGTRRNTDDDEHAIFEATLKSGYPMVAMINTVLLNWDRKASHPWMASMDIKYGKGNRGMPNDAANSALTQIDKDIENNLNDEDGYLYVGRETGNYTRTIHIACKEFRKPSKVLYQIQQRYAPTLEIGYEIIKDKYWQSLSRFQQV